MFHFLKRLMPEIRVLDPYDTPENHRYERIGEHVFEVLESVEVDVKRRTFLWGDGAALGIAEVARRIHAAQPDMAPEDIESCVIDWLEEAYVPEGISIKRMEKLDRKIEAWIEAHHRSRETTPS